MNKRKELQVIRKAYKEISKLQIEALEAGSDDTGLALGGIGILLEALVKDRERRLKE